MTDTLTPNPPQAPASRPGRFAPLWKGLIVVSILLLVAMWVYAFGFATKKAAYRVDDDAWRARGQEICTEYEAERLKLVDTDEGYIAEPTQAQMIERADVVDKATDIIVQELTDVLAVPPPTERDQALVADYQRYYETLIADRRAYTAQLRTFELQPYYETLLDGGPVSNLLTDFTVVNEMNACAPPGELGGDS